MISTRWSVPTAILLALALVPTAIHGYFGYVVEDGRRAARVEPVLAGMTSRPTDRSDEWMARKFDSADWSERWYGPGTALRLSVVRSYDPKKLYHHPELAISYREMRVGASQRTTLPGRTGVPVVAVRAADDQPGVAVYALHYGDEFVGNPYVFQARQAVELLFTGRRPMTLIYVQDLEALPGVAVGQTMAMRLLAAAVEAWESQAKNR